MAHNRASRSVDFTRNQWVYGHDVFEDGSVIPWIRFAEHWEPGRVTYTFDKASRTWVGECEYSAQAERKI